MADPGGGSGAPIRPDACMRPKFLHPQDRISLFNLMKRALYSASKLNSRDIQKCNFLGIPSYDLDPPSPNKERFDCE